MGISLNDQNAGDGALQGVRVLDLTDERGIYGAKLLADLGADVVRVEPPEGDPLRARGPHYASADEDSGSLYFAFFASNRRLLTLDFARGGEAQLARLIAHADIVLQCDRGFVADAVDLEAMTRPHSGLIVVDLSSFGQAGPWRDFLAPDLVAGALGGAVATTGDVDTPPLKGFGELNFMISGAYVAIAALSGLFHRRVSGEGQVANISVHECIVSCLEQVLMFYWYADTLQSGQRVLPRQGSAHWSNAFKVFNGRNGSIMVTPTPDWDAQLAWLIEEGVHEDLIDPRYSQPENLRERIMRTMQILEKWVAGQDVEALFFAAQARHSPYGWVLPLERLADNPQLEARSWFVPYRTGEAEFKGPGAPMRFSATPWRMGPSTDAESDAQALLEEMGWSSAP